MDPSHDLAADAPDRASGSADPGNDRPDSESAGLTDRDVRILDFERQWWRHAGSKEQAIRQGFGFSPTRYYQVLNALLDSPDALAHDPTLVKRLRRLRASRSRAR